MKLCLPGDLPAYPLSPTKGFGFDGCVVDERVENLRNQREAIMGLLTVARHQATLLAHTSRTRFRLEELLAGVKDEAMADLYAETAWVQAGSPVGREWA